jgi:hypothetical protein
MNTDPPRLNPGEPPPSVVVATPGASPPAPPWGFWATLAFSLGIALAYLMAQSAIVVVAAIMEGTLNDPRAIEALAYNGLVLSLATLLSVPVAVGLCVLFAWIRPGTTVREYLALTRVSWKRIALGLLSVVALGIGFELVNRLLERPVVPDFMVNAYQTAEFVPLLWLAVVLGAPIVEETFFRGFLFAGWSVSPLGGWATVVVTSLGWAAIHVQYDLFDLGYIFALGLLLGGFRLKTGSLWPPVLMHMLVNLLATIQVALLLN